MMTIVCIILVIYIMYKQIEYGVILKVIDEKMYRLKRAEELSIEYQKIKKANTLEELEKLEEELEKWLK